MNETAYWNQMYANACDGQRPFLKLRPRVFLDGNQWCALYGENIQDGVAGFGDSPEYASWNFDKAWYEKIGETAQYFLIKPTTPEREMSDNRLETCRARYTQESSDGAWLVRRVDELERQLAEAQELITDLETQCSDAERAVDRLNEEIARMKPVVEATKAYKAAYDEVIRLYDLEEDINTAMGDRQQAENLLFLTICDLEHEQLTPNDQHNWECISPGEYDFTYQCTKCGKKNVESIDNPSTDNPVHGCSGTKGV